jgi:hypothetical protein
MKTMNRWLLMTGIAGVMCFASSALAQQDNPPGPQGGRGNFDPAQMRERMMDRVKQQLEINDDAEWKAVQPLVQKVMDARLASAGGMGRGMFGGPPRRGGDNAGGGGDQAPRRAGFGQPSPEAEALQKAIDGKASNSELKAAIAKVAEGRKAKQAELEKAQADLKKVLSVRQEAIATANGWL